MSDSLEPYINSELEARIVAMVVGEASPFETEALEQEIKTLPEVKLFYDRMVQLHELLGTIKADDTASLKDDQWKLPKKKRAKLIEQLSQDVADGSDDDSVVQQPSKTRKRLPLIQLAAALVIMAVAVALVAPTFMSSGLKISESSMKAEEALSEKLVTPEGNTSFEARKMNGKTKEAWLWGYDDQSIESRSEGTVMVGKAGKDLKTAGEDVLYLNAEDKPVDESKGSPSPPGFGIAGAFFDPKTNEISDRFDADEKLNSKPTLTPYVGYNGAPDGWGNDGQISAGKDAKDVFFGGVSLGVDFGSPEDLSQGEAKGSSVDFGRQQASEKPTGSMMFGAGRSSIDSETDFGEINRSNFDDVAGEQSRSITVTAAENLSLLAGQEVAAEESKQNYYYESAREQTRAKFLSQVDNDWVSPVPAESQTEQAITGRVDNRRGFADRSQLKVVDVEGGDISTEDDISSRLGTKTGEVIRQSEILRDKAWLNRSEDRKVQFGYVGDGTPLIGRDKVGVPIQDNKPLPPSKTPTPKTAPNFNNVYFGGISPAASVALGSPDDLKSQESQKEQRIDGNEAAQIDDIAGSVSFGYDSDYVWRGVGSSANRAAKGREIDSVVLAEGKIAEQKAIDIEGNSKTKDHVVRRELADEHFEAEAYGDESPFNFASNSSGVLRAQVRAVNGGILDSESSDGLINGTAIAKPKANVQAPVSGKPSSSTASSVANGRKQSLFQRIFGRGNSGQIDGVVNRGELKSREGTVGGRIKLDDLALFDSDKDVSKEVRKEIAGKPIVEGLTKLSQTEGRLQELSNEVNPESLERELQEAKRELSEREKRKEALVASVQKLVEEQKTLKDKISSEEGKQRNRRNKISLSSTEATVVGKNDEWGFLIVNAGKDLGVKPNSKLVVKRDGRQVATMRVTTLRDKVSVCEVVEGSLSDIETGVQTGDKIIFQDSFGDDELSPKKEAPKIPLSETSASENPFSTFSLHVSDVSFKLAHAALMKGEWPEAERIRLEEFVNAMDYFDQTPSAAAKISATVEQAIHPTLTQRNVMRIALKTAEMGRNSQTPLNLVFLLDSSGSMERFDRQETLSRAFALLANQLNPQDKVTLISFARTPRLIADGMSGDQCKELVRLVAGLPEEGGTNLEAALKLAHQKALEYHQGNVQSRVILLTDGAANLGSADPEQLSKLVIEMRNKGLAFDAAGLGAEDLNDEILEALTRKGDGRYYVLNKPEDADANFARQIAGALRPAAMNVKVQVVFNPLRVGKYQLHGYEKHRLNKEDFKNDKVDAAELSAAEAGVAVYHFEPLPEGVGDIGEVKVRFRDMSTGKMFERSWPIPYNASSVRFDDAPDSIKLATTAAIVAAKLKGKPLGSRSEWHELAATMDTLDSKFRANPSVVMLTEIIQKALTIK